MAQTKWWIFCALSLASLAHLGSSRRHRAHGQQPIIFNELCAMKADPGPCRAIKDRYFFNVSTARCEEFEYGGCSGNSNNFVTLQECEETCVVSDEKNPCHLEEAPGPCRGLLSRYFFDSKTRQCRRFFYGGCFGNANNFWSMGECQAKCQNPGPTDVGEVVEPTNVHMRQEGKKETSSAAPQVSTRAPRRFSFVQPLVASENLAAANEPLVQINNSLGDVNSLTPADICLSPVDPGDCDGQERRYFYHPKARRCYSFWYTGCGGNKNNFRIRKHCVHKCVLPRRGFNLSKTMIRIRKKNVDSIVNLDA
uniref:Tissue factor pathway inhibitor n=1 Tax=Oryzias latipes TaxID=8090 RepID=A0A3P9K9S3_ORYLA